MKDIEDYQLSLGCGFISAIITVAAIVSMCLHFTWLACGFGVIMALVSIYAFDEAKDEKENRSYKH